MLAEVTRIRKENREQNRYLRSRCGPVQGNPQRKISMCGLHPAVIGLETLRQLGVLRKSRRVAYATSAEVTGDPSRVVGYAGMLFG